VPNETEHTLPLKSYLVHGTLTGRLMFSRSIKLGRIACQRPCGPPIFTVTGYFKNRQDPNEPIGVCKDMRQLRRH